jgi:hypothetical protein
MWILTLSYFVINFFAVPLLIALRGGRMGVMKSNEPEEVL